MQWLEWVVVKWDAETSRAGVRIDGRGDTLAVRPENLQISRADSSSGGAEAAAGHSISSAPPPKPSVKRSGPLRINHLRGEKELAEEFEEIEDLCDGKEKATISLLHKVACERGYEQYVDPSSGYSVFTALQLRTRPCCGHVCRHCPYGHENVPKRRKGGGAR